MNLVALQRDHRADNREIMMIPKRDNQERPGVGDFTIEHEQARRQVAAALQVSGSTVIVASERPGLTAYYVARILEQLSALERNLAPKIRQLPADRDGILDVLNERLANVDLDNVADARVSPKHRAREIWVYESLTSFKADGVCFGAKIIRQFHAAGISLLVSVTPGETNAAALKKLLHSCKAQRWDFGSPTQKQCDNAMALAAGTPSFGAVQGVIRDMGMMANLQTPPEVLDFPKATALGAPRMDTDFDVRQLLKAQRKQNKSRRSLPVSAAPDEQPKKLFVLFQLVAGIVFMGVVVSLQFDLLPRISDNPEPGVAVATVSAIDQVAEAVNAAEVAATEMTPIKETPAQAAVAQSEDLSEVAATETITIASTTPVVVNDADLMGLFADPEPIGLAQQVREVVPTVASAAVVQPPAAAKKRAGIFVQHGSFAQLQGALVMQNNLTEEVLTSVYVKGTNPKRFVVVSGPFADRQIAKNTLISGSDAFLVPAHAVGEEVMSLSGL